MTDYKKLVRALRCNGTSMNGSCVGKKCGYYANGFCESMRMHTDAADAIEELQQIADHHEQTAKDYWKEACEYKAQMPKRGEIVRCGECAHCYAEGFAHERNICEKHPELGNVPDDWFCADGEREVQDGQE